jgi:HD-GYP domain-containing protein (c-di-GMP phosphodiesterase class II)
MSPALKNHHFQVAYLGYRLAEALELPIEERNEIMLAGMLHDIGAFSIQERFELMEFEDLHADLHCLSGYHLLKQFRLFENVARLIRYHHTPWENGRQAGLSEAVQRGSHIIHLADRAVVQISPNYPVLAQVSQICDRLIRCQGEIFPPRYVDSLCQLAKKDYIWLEVTSDFLELILRRIFFHRSQELLLADLLDFSKLLCRLIDFKSKFTATHSSGVAAVAVALAGDWGFSRNERGLIEIAAYLHDLGKLAIPSEILEKKENLTEQEWFVMRSHVYYTYQSLAPFDTLETINTWGSLHQERLNGSGYPFGYHSDELPLGAKIMGVADVFTALTEDRPYRKGMGNEGAKASLDEMARNEELDPGLIRAATGQFDALNEIRELAQKKAAHNYKAFQADLHTSK